MTHDTSVPVRHTRCLRHGETLVVDDPRGPALICTEGALWVTLEQAPPGRVPQRMARLHVRAMSDATVHFPRV